MCSWKETFMCLGLDEMEFLHTLLFRVGMMFYFHYSYPAIPNVGYKKREEHSFYRLVYELCWDVKIPHGVIQAYISKYKSSAFPSITYRFFVLGLDANFSKLDLWFISYIPCLGIERHNQVLHRTFCFISFISVSWKWFIYTVNEMIISMFWEVSESNFLKKGKEPIRCMYEFGCVQIRFICSIWCFFLCVIWLMAFFAVHQTLRNHFQLSFHFHLTKSHHTEL